MRVHFHGTACVVTGFVHVVEAAGRRALPGMPLLILGGEIGERDGIEVALVRAGMVFDA